MRRNFALLTIAGLAVLLVTRVWAHTPAAPAAGFQGYWMGVDPVDGGDSRRGLVQLDNGRFALAGRDSVLTLCDGTDRGFVSFDDGEEIGHDVLQSNALILKCFNNGASVVLLARYELVGKGLMVEHLTRPDGSAVTNIVFHKVSQD
jgi:hypothetical protein